MKSLQSFLSRPRLYSYSSFFDHICHSGADVGGEKKMVRYYVHAEGGGAGAGEWYHVRDGVADRGGDGGSSSRSSSSSRRRRRPRRRCPSPIDTGCSSLSSSSASPSCEETDDGDAWSITPRTSVRRHPPSTTKSPTLRSILRVKTEDGTAMATATGTAAATTCTAIKSVRFADGTKGPTPTAMYVGQKLKRKGGSSSPRTTGQPDELLLLTSSYLAGFTMAGKPPQHHHHPDHQYNMALYGTTKTPIVVCSF